MFVLSVSVKIYLYNYNRVGLKLSVIPLLFSSIRKFSNVKTGDAEHSQINHLTSKNNTKINQMTMENSPIVFKSFKAVQSYLNKLEYRDLESVKKLWSLYNGLTDIDGNEKSSNLKGEGEVKRCYPLIVLEGLDGTGKTTITKRLAEILNAKLLCTPPDSLQEIRSMYEDCKLFRTAFYSFGNYIASREIEKILQHHPVVLDRFWHSTTAYALAQAVNNNPDTMKLPSYDDNIYCWPDDLLKPDIVLFLSVSEVERQKRMSRRNTSQTIQEEMLKTSDQFRENVINAYKNMQNPGIIFVDGDPSVEVIIEDIITKIQDLL